MNYEAYIFQFSDFRNEHEVSGLKHKETQSGKWSPWATYKDLLMVDLDHVGACHSHIPLHDRIHAFIWQESILMILIFNHVTMCNVIHFMFELVLDGSFKHYIELTVMIFIQLTSVINLWTCCKNVIFIKEYLLTKLLM